MENEDLNLDELDTIEASADRKLKVKNRFEQLSEKVIIEARGKEEAEAKLKAEADARLQAEKERDFFKDFSSKSSKYQGAAEYQDKIWEKVKGGYDTEDAIVAVMAREGKPIQAEQRPTYSAHIEGGSSPTNLGDGGNKELNSMSTQDKLATLQQLEKEGAIALT